MKAMRRIGNSLDTDAITDGTGNSSKRLLGMSAWVSGDPTTGTVARINRANVSAWASKIVNNGNVIGDLLVDMRDLWSQCKSGPRKPTFILCNEAFERALEGQYTATIRHNLPSGAEGKGHSGDAALTDLFYKGAPVFVSENFTQYGTTTGPGQCIMVNESTWAIIHANSMAKSDMIEFVPEQRSPSQTAMVSGVRFHGELFCDEPRKNGTLHNVGADA